MVVIWLFMTYGPSKRDNREMYTNIRKCRIEAGLTVAALAEMCMTAPGWLSSYQNGSTSPFYQKGQRAGRLKPTAELICLALEKTPEELFPFEYCALPEPPVETVFLDDLSTDENMFLVEVDERIHSGQVAALALKALRGRGGHFSGEATRLHVLEGVTLDETGRQLGVTKQRIWQCIVSDMKYLRKRFKAAGVTD